jgi:hypothetical protein
LKNELPWFKFNATDWISDPSIRLMSSRQVGWYIHLLAYCWQEGGLIGDLRALKELSQAYRDELAARDHDDEFSTDEITTFSDEFESVVALFSVTLPNGKITHPKLHKQLSESLILREKQIAGGHKGAERRYSSVGKHELTNSSPKGHQPVRASTSVSYSSSKESENTKNQEVDFHIRFRLLKDRHPGNKTRDGDCRARYVSLLGQGPDPVAVADSLDAKQSLWLTYWKKSKAPPLGLWNYLSGGDCMIDPPELPKERSFMDD